MFKKILCATDLNKTSRDVVKKSVQLAHQYDSKIIMLNIHEEFMTKEEMGMLRVSIDKMKLVFEKIALKAKNEMKELIQKLHAEEILVEYVIKEGKAQHIICDESKKVQADLIVMGNSEKNIITDIFFKSTSAYVIDHVDVPVLIVKNKS